MYIHFTNTINMKLYMSHIMWGKIKGRKWAESGWLGPFLLGP